MDRWLPLCVIVALLLFAIAAALVAYRRRRRRTAEEPLRGVASSPPAAEAAEGSASTTHPSTTLLTITTPLSGDGSADAVDAASGLDAAAPSSLASVPEAAQRSLIVLTRPSASRHPIVLAHGYFGFERIGLSQMGQDYFRGVRRRLEALGYSVYVTRVSPAAGIRVRAAQLAKQIERLGVARVNIIAHSMGGLDARLAISALGLSTRVASLTTIGTPHHGTPLADMALSLGDWRRMRGLLDVLGMNIDGLYDVSTARMREFNHAVVDVPDVSYASVVGAVPAGSTAAVNALLLPGHAYLLRKGGPNDGVVPALSQRWGRAVADVEADHWAQIGWFGRFDVESFYMRLAEGLAERDL